MHAQDDLNLCILSMFEGTFSLDVAQTHMFRENGSLKWKRGSYQSNEKSRLGIIASVYEKSYNMQHCSCPPAPA